MKALIDGSAQNILDLIDCALKISESKKGKQTQHELFSAFFKLLDDAENMKIAKGLKQSTIENSIYHKAKKACNQDRGNSRLRFWSIYLDSICQFVFNKDFEEHYGKFRDEQPVLSTIEKRPDQGIAEADSTFFESLSDLGITGTTSGLTNSGFEPLECIEVTTYSLSFMGILGSKWIEDLDRLEEFLALIQSKGGIVRFLLINPRGKNFETLHTMRGGNLIDKSSVKFKELTQKYSCLQVRFYDFIPSFRLIFIDDKLLALSRYKLDKKGYFQSKQGWDAPHLVIETGTIWSLYEPFLSYYNFIWDNNAKSISKVIT